MRAKLVAAICLSLIPVSFAFAGDEPYRARKGDTLWDLSRKNWRDPKAWPELWSLNPHLRNPHIVEPGDPIFLRRRGPDGSLVRLPVETLGTGAATGVDTGTGKGARATGAGSATSPKAGPATIRISRRDTADFVSSHRVARLGTIANRRLVKDIYSLGEDVEFDAEAGADLKPGDLVTVFSDDFGVTHPLNGEPQGYLVRILGQMKVLSATGSKGVGVITENWFPVANGAGLMPLRTILTQIEPRPSKAGVEGVVLRGLPEQSLMATEDVVFLDRGSLHGLEPGAVLEVPIPEHLRNFAGLVDLRRPVARVLVVSVEDKTATGLILASRGSVAAGDRFVPMPFSP